MPANLWIVILFAAISGAVIALYAASRPSERDKRP